jgi:preprotein translocase subunit SecG
MTTVIIVIHLMVVLAMIGLVLLQRSEGGALGIGGGQGAFMTGRSAGNVLTRATGILAIAFFATSLGLALLAKFESRPSDILERLPGTAAPTADTPAPAEPLGAPTSAEDILRQLGGTSPGPQAPPESDAAPATDSAPTAPATDAAPVTTPAPPPASSAPAAETTPPPAANEEAPAPAPAPAPAQ